MLSSCGRLPGKLPFRLGDVLDDKFGPSADILKPGRGKAPPFAVEAGHGGGLRRRRQGIARPRQGAVDLDDGAGNVEALARPPGLRLHAHGAHPRQQLPQLVGDGYQFVVHVVVFHALEDLMIAVQAAAEPVMGAAPHAGAQLSIVLAALSGRSK